MTPYDGPDRRNPDPILVALHEFREDMAGRLGRIEEAAKGHEARLTNHSERIELVCERTTSLESSRDYAKGVIKAVGVAVPAVGSVAWLLIELVKTIKSLKGGG